MDEDIYKKSLEDQTTPISAKSGGGGGATGSIMGSSGGAGALVENLGKTAMAIYQEKLAKEKKNRERADIMQELSRGMSDRAADTSMGSTIHNTNMLSNAFLRNLIGG